MRSHDESDNSKNHILVENNCLSQPANVRGTLVRVWGEGVGCGLLSGSSQVCCEGYLRFIL